MSKLKSALKSTTKQPKFNAGVLPQEGFVRQAHLLSIVPLSAAELWRRVAAGTFPRPIKLSPMVSAWRVSDIRKFIAQFGSAT